MTVEADVLEEKFLEEIRKLAQVDTVSYDGRALAVTYRKGKNNLVELIEFLKSRNISYRKIYSERPTLNDVFLELTGKELRD